MSQNSAVTTIRSRKANPVLMCRKCLSRIDSGTDLKKALKSELKRRSVARGIKRPRVVLTSCFGICPKQAVVVANGETLNRDEYLLLRDADAVAEAATILIPPKDR